MFVLISWEQGESQRDPITVCKKPHLNDGIGPVFFAFTVFLIPVLLFNFKIIVAAIVVECYPLVYNKLFSTIFCKINRVPE